MLSRPVLGEYEKAILVASHMMNISSTPLAVVVNTASGPSVTGSVELVKLITALVLACAGCMGIGTTALSRAQPCCANQIC